MVQRDALLPLVNSQKGYKLCQVSVSENCDVLYLPLYMSFIHHCDNRSSSLIILFFR